MNTTLLRLRMSCAVISLLTLLTLELSAQIQWEYMNGPLCASVGIVDIADNGDIYIISECGMHNRRSNLYRSTDLGMTWVEIPTDSTNPDIVYVLEDNVIYAGNNYSLMRSSDFGLTWEKDIERGPETMPHRRTASGMIYTGYAPCWYSLDDGQTWSTIQEPTYGKYFAVVCADSKGTFYGRSNTDTLYISTDFGQTWKKKELAAGKNVNAVYIDNDDNILVVLYKTIASSTDNGETWTVRPGNILYSYYYTMGPDGALYVFNTHGDIEVTRDLGETWQIAYTEPQILPLKDGLAFAPDGRAFVCTNQGLYVGMPNSTDLVPVFTDQGGRCSIEYIFELNDNRFMVFTDQYGNVYRTNDNGSDWEINRPHSSSENYIIARSGEILRFIHDNIEMSTDNGASWESLPNEEEIEFREMNSIYMKTGVVMDAKGVLYANTQYDTTSGPPAYRVRVSDDDGRTWRYTGIEYPHEVLGVDADNRVYVYGFPENDYTLSCTTDGGRTWQPGPKYPKGRTIFSPTGMTYILTEDTIASGPNWTTLSNPYGLPFRTVVADDADCLYAIVGYDNNVVRSCDGGTTWTYISDGLSEVYCSDQLLLADNGRLYIATSAGMYRTSGPVVTSLGPPAAVANALPSTYPNPVAAGQNTSLTFGMARSGEVTLALYSLLGTKVFEVELGWKDMGKHQCMLPTRGLTPGIYQLVLRNGGEVRNAKVVIQ